MENTKNESDLDLSAAAAEIRDAVDQATVDAVVAEATPPTMVRPPKAMVLNALARMIAAGEMRSSDAARIRREMGISKRFFTKKKKDKAKEKVRAKIAKASRRRNRGTGKGEKRSSGTFR